MLYYNPIFILLLLQSLIFIIFIETIDGRCHCSREKVFDSNVNEGVFKSPGYPSRYCDFLDCKWNIQPAENTFVYAEFKTFTEQQYDFLETRWNGSELIRVKHASLSGESFDNVPIKHLRLSSAINDGLLFHFITDDTTSNFRGFEISFSRKSGDKIERFSSFNSFPSTLTSKTGSVSVLISVFDLYDRKAPYQIEFVAVKKHCDCFPNNLTLCRVHPLNLLSPGFPEYCHNLNCSTQISLESPHITREYVESLQIQFNSFQTEVEKDLLHLKIPDVTKDSFNIS
ncbi:unnamed protein product [Meloidogyne enterolobii]|uniref:Uncharacterized protein n=1 Tax=Meloidogyne enterolobii TaxID=390850 RepID=A0ACB1AQI6_MELEN